MQKQVELNRKAIRVIGMGSWRLKTFVSETLQLFVANLEGAWRHMVDDLGLYPMKPVRRVHIFLIRNLGQTKKDGRSAEHQCIGCGQ